MIDRQRLVALLDRWGAVLPDRIAEEDLGGFIEQVNRDSTGRFRPYLLIVSAVLCTGCNSIREAPFLINPALSRRIAMWIAAVNLVFAYFFSREPIEHLGRSPDPLVFAQCLAGVALSVFWIGSGIALWRRWPHAQFFALGTAAATILHTVWLFNIMGTFGLVSYTVYPLAVLVFFAASARERPQP